MSSARCPARRRRRHRFAAQDLIDAIGEYIVVMLRPSRACVTATAMCTWLPSPTMHHLAWTRYRGTVATGAKTDRTAMFCNQSADWRPVGGKNHVGDGFVDHDAFPESHRDRLCVEAASAPRRLAS